MATTTHPTRAHKPAASTANPFSASAAKLIEHIQAEARAQLLAELSAKDTVTVLHGFDPATKRVQVDADSINITDGLGNCVRLHRKYQEPESWRAAAHMRGYWHPARWFGQQDMVDASGTTWNRELSPLVCDDFGNLVQVAR